MKVNLGRSTRNSRAPEKYDIATVHMIQNVIGVVQFQQYDMGLIRKSSPREKEVESCHVVNELLLLLACMYVAWCIENPRGLTELMLHVMAWHTVSIPCPWLPGFPANRKRLQLVCLSLSLSLSLSVSFIPPTKEKKRQRSAVVWRPPLLLTRLGPVKQTDPCASLGFCDARQDPSNHIQLCWPSSSLAAAEQLTHVHFRVGDRQD